MTGSWIPPSLLLLACTTCLACETGTSREETKPAKHHAKPNSAKVLRQLNALSRDFGHTPIGNEPLTLTWSDETRVLSYEYVNYRAILPMEEIEPEVRDRTVSEQQFAWWVVLKCQASSKCIRYDFDMANVGDRFVSMTNDFRFSSKASAEEFAHELKKLTE